MRIDGVPQCALTEREAPVSGLNLTILPAFRYLNTEAQKHRDLYGYDDKIPELCFHPLGEIGV